jgi:DNA-binding transcriptional LysR family regulator
MAGLQAFLAFTETAKHGGFAGAAREMGLSASAVAKSVGRLEEDLGLRLFHRTTRQVTLTSEGHELYARCRRIVGEIEALRDEAAGARSEPTGTLRLSAPVVLGRLFVVPALAALTQRYPRLALDIAFSDRYADLIKEGLDAVVRVGHLPDSSLVARQIGEQSLLVCGAPSYLRTRGTPRAPADLAAHTCLLFRMPSTGRLRPWQLQDGRRAIEFVPESACIMNDGEALVAAAAEGMGLLQVPDYMAAHEIRAGRLIEVLARYRAPPLPISVVYPSARHLTPRLRVLIEAMCAAHGAPSNAPAKQRRASGRKRPD